MNFDEIRNGIKLTCCFPPCRFPRFLHIPLDYPDKETFYAVGALEKGALEKGVLEKGADETRPEQGRFATELATASRGRFRLPKVFWQRLGWQGSVFKRPVVC